ncbi:hypothetical protein MMRN_15130 [Mycobacterium marinum]|nr:hypothetical protein MMRN_15130 [Mycobacterium marinum]GJO75135.1 hypothetical protein NJB1728f31_04150 [Mycobacterium marinum]GJP04785.1 hypothetical protein NJB18001_27030 [Mycobacterium marinum]GJP24089.1 hypothetical protein NJB1808_29950 [Mycobacterium marinum]
MLFQLAAAALSEAEPGPVYMRVELISGGNIIKLMNNAPCLVNGPGDGCGTGACR